VATASPAKTNSRAQTELDGRLTKRIAAALKAANVHLGLTPEQEPGELDDFNAALDALKIALENVLGHLRGSEIGSSETRLSTDLALELQSLQHELHEERLGQRFEALARVQEALGRLRGVGTMSQMLDAATVELCRSCGFDRALLFRVQNSQMIIESVHFEGDPDWARQFTELARAHKPKLNHLLLETEMIRRRGPMLVSDAQNDQRTFKPLIEPLRMSSYVAAPIMPEDRVIGFLHADRHFAKRPVDMLDRDTLWTFAEGFGHTVERAVLLERLNAQRDRIRLMMDSTEAILDEFCNAEVELLRSDNEGAAVARTAASLVSSPESRLEALLTRREFEVLALMGEGATNAAIANRLVISEGTVKSHVKHILRKLRAANRAEAVSRYLRLASEGRDS
jgi:DNA-binding CsgD family transcriptional regulator